MLISIVIPVFNEEEVLPTFHASLTHVLTTLPHEFEVLYVAGGSTDRTSNIIAAWHQEDHRIKLLELSRNYGHQAALTAGIDFARGDIVISMDGDGQHPPELIPQLIEKFEEGNDLVLTKRQAVENITFLTRFFSETFYRLINWLGETHITPNSSDFRLISREVADDLRTLREQHRFLRGMVVWLGYRQAILEYTAPSRKAGKSKFSLRKRLRLAGDAISSFSIVPILLVSLAGIVLLVLTLFYAIYVVVVILSSGSDQLPRGWASLMLVILSTSGLQLLLTGVVGYYVGLNFQESKGRPVYFVNKRISRLDDDTTG